MVLSDRIRLCSLRELSEALKEEKITSRECVILKMVYGLGEDKQNFAEIGHNFDVSRHRIRDIYYRAVRKIRRFYPDVNTNRKEY